VVCNHLLFGDRRYFRELQANSIEGIASNILADRLKRLVKSGLLTREDTRPGQRARNSLAEPAIQLVPVFAQLGSGGLGHRPTSSALNARAGRADLRMTHGSIAEWPAVVPRWRARAHGA
jgi:DNA-binding HxlR family transcriptional regulator